MFEKKLKEQFIQYNKEHPKSYLIYPNDEGKQKWDILMTIVLIVTCFFTPINIAFSYSDSETNTIINYAIDFFYFIDIVVIFNTAIFD